MLCRFVLVANIRPAMEHVMNSYVEGCKTKSGCCTDTVRSLEPISLAVGEGGLKLYSTDDGFIEKSNVPVQ